MAEPAPGGDVTVVPLLARLTDAEARVALAVAAGATNREIAERSFVSVKTVEATLTRVYRKLDVGSRTRLAALLAPQTRVWPRVGASTRRRPGAPSRRLDAPSPDPARQTRVFPLSTRVVAA